MIPEIRSRIEEIDDDKTLLAETNYLRRAEALDALEFHVLERIESVQVRIGPDPSLADLRETAETVKSRLETVDDRLFQRLRANVAAGNYTRDVLKRLLLGYVGGVPGGYHGMAEGYDTLDSFVNGLLLMGAAPQQTKDREPEMVFYQPTPARIVLELVITAEFRPQDFFCDIGSGLGQVAILVQLLSGVRTRGVEYEPAYCDYARRCAAALQLSQVAFLCADAREADLSDGTVFFMYTPFVGRMLEQALQRLRDCAGARSIKLFTYGPCTLQVAQQDWLTRLDQGGDNPYRLATFQTR